MKSCGDCGLCCKLMGVRELEKSAGKWCTHFRRGRGCDAYETRPSSCRTFNCTWLLAEGLGPDWKPSHCGFVMHVDAGRLILECDPSRPHAWRAQPFLSVLRDWAGQGQEVLIFAGRRGLRLNADGETPVARAV